MEGLPGKKIELNEEGRIFDFTFYEYSSETDRTPVLIVPGACKKEAFDKFEETFGRKFGSEMGDGFISQ